MDINIIKDIKIEEINEKIGLLKNRLENINATLSMPIPDNFHVKAMRELIPSLIEDSTEILELIEEIA